MTKVDRNSEEPVRISRGFECCVPACMRNTHVACTHEPAQTAAGAKRAAAPMGRGMGRRRVPTRRGG
jgi:hypothetical protein